MAVFDQPIFTASNSLTYTTQRTYKNINQCSITRCALTILYPVHAKICLFTAPDVNHKCPKHPATCRDVLEVSCGWARSRWPQNMGPYLPQQKAGRKVNINTQPWSTMCWNAKDMKGHSNIIVWRTIYTNHYIIILSTYLLSSLKFYEQFSVQGDKSESISWQRCIHLSSHPPRWETVGLVSAWYNDGSDDRQESTNPKFLVWHRFAFSSFIAGPQNHQLQCNWICLMSWRVFLQT